MQLIFLRSESQQPITESTGCTFVNDLVRLPNGSWRWNGEPKKITKTKPLEDQLMSNFIIFGNAHQLFRLTERTNPGFVFDLVLVDEASQLPTDNFLSSLQYIKNQTFHILCFKTSSLITFVLPSHIVCPVFSFGCEAYWD